MSSKGKPYVLYVAELIYSEVCEIKKKNPYLNNVDAIEAFIGSDTYTQISSGKFHDGWFKKLKKNKKSVNEKNHENYLQTRNIPDPDLLIRTGNTKRLSNFLLWQLAYSEIFFEKKLWPEFDEKDYNRIITNFRKIKRNFGKI